MRRGWSGRNGSGRDESRQRDPERKRDAIHEAPSPVEDSRAMVAATRQEPGLGVGVEQFGFERLALDIVTVALLPALFERHRELEDA